jgi:hypothetical protein
MCYHLVMRATGQFPVALFCLALIHGASGLEGIVVVEPQVGDLVFSHKVT